MTLNGTAVFVCHCGGNISEVVDIEKVRQRLAEEGVTHFDDYPYLCSEEGQDLIRKHIKRGDVDRVVIASCSPKVHEHTFRACLEGAGLNRFMLDIANIREQCAWVSPDHATERAVDLIRASLYAVQHATPMESYRFTPVNDVAVIGGGIAGITAAKNLAKLGIKSYLIEDAPTIGGSMVKIGKVISPEKLSEDCAMCSLSPLMGELAHNKRVEIRTNTRVSGVSGKAGDFTLELECGPYRVSLEKCRACGRCEDVCQATAPDEWNAGMDIRKAIYRPFPQSIPSAYTIDTTACTSCGNCVKVCSSHAIDLARIAKADEVRVGAIIIATGHEEMDPSERHELGYGSIPEVLTQMELARLLAINGPTKGKLELKGKKPKHVVMVQCVGSRDEKPGSIPYCSKICCVVAMKHASYIREHFPGTEVTLCYTDMRAPGMYESYYQEAQRRGVHFLRGRVGEIVKKGGTVYVRVEDTLAMRILGLEADIVVLSTAIVPSEGTKQVSKILGVATTPELFVRERHPKLEPGLTSVPGIFVCGTAAGAKDITESIMQAQSTAMNAVGMVLDYVEVEPDYAVIDQAKCTQCMECVDVCGQRAIFADGVVSIDPMSCVGRGGCVPRCPENAISLLGSGDEALLAKIDGCLKDDGGKVLAFLDNKIGYVAADNAGTNRLRYPDDVRIISVPSVLRLEPRHLIYAFNKGARGIFLGDGTANAGDSLGGENVSKHVEWLTRGVSEAGLDPRRIFYYEAYLPHYKGLASRLTSFRESLSMIGPP
jgi:heterodisulfide reductase subunit A-like polyferredoxin/coenzyme F420-reducing hydrogenase delta subunit